MISAKIRTKWIIGRTKWILEYFSYLALVEYRTKWIRIKWGPGVRFLEEIEDTKKTFRNYLTFMKVEKMTYFFGTFSFESHHIAD